MTELNRARTSWSNAIVYAGIGLLLLTGSALRVPGTAFEDVSFDEVYSWALVQCEPAAIPGRTAADVHPPLYYLILWAVLAVTTTSAWTLRLPSIVFGVLAIPVAYLLCRTALRGDRVTVSPIVARAASLFAAGLTAVHGGHVYYSQIGRMYSLGVLLAGLSGLFLLLALRPGMRQRLWWGMYALSVAAFCYTHNYAFFTIAAQTVFVAIEIVKSFRRGEQAWARRACLGFVLSGVAAFAAYSPWLPVLLSQSRSVQGSYWIPVPELDELATAACNWTLGYPYKSLPAVLAAAVVIAGVAVLSIWLFCRSVGFFTLQAVAPWAICLGVSYLSGRSIFVERYLIYAHFSFILLCSVVWARLPGGASRLGFGVVLIVATVVPSVARLGDRPASPPAANEAARYLGDHATSADVLVSETGYRVNYFRFYAAANGSKVTVKYAADPFRPLVMTHHGDGSHVSLLDPEVYVLKPDDARRLRGVVYTESTTASRVQAITRTRQLTRIEYFHGGETEYTLYVFEPPR